MKKTTMMNFLTVLLLSSLPLVSFSQVPPTGLAGCKNKYLGNIIAGSVPANYNSLWNAVTSENDCKWGSVEPTRDVYNWTGADRAYNHAKNNGLKFRWHAIAWGSQYPSWIAGLSSADLKAEVEEYMMEIAKRYPNSIDQIDVLNENLRTHAPGTNIFRDGLGGLNNGVAPDRGTGYDWIVWLFRTARKHFPNSKLILNDYGLENDQSAINEQLLIVKVLKDRGLIDGFGTQAHEFNINTLSAAQLKSSLDLMATGGVPIYVTELDISGDDATQNQRYQTLFPVYWNHPSVAGISLWGYEEGKTWIGNTQLIRSNGTDRPAMTWLKSFMAAQPNTGCNNTPPTVSITAPLNNATFTAPAVVNITANAADANGTVSNVQFFNGTTLLGSDATSPYSFSWGNVAAGTYTLTARATDNAGAVTTSTVITIVVNPPVNTPPTVSITAPANNASFTAPASISITANAADANGTVSNVQFFNGTTLLGSDATSPYSFSWTNVTAGTYSLTAVATDNAGASTTSAAVTVTVTNPVTQSPFGGTPASIPGKIEAENYDLGGQGIAFNETTAGNAGNSYRTDNVDIEATADAGGGYNVGWIASGEWLEYTVNVTAAGTYNLEARVASQNAGTTFHIEMDGVNISGVIAVPNTGAWQTYQTVTIPNISLTAGQKVMRIAMDASWFNINYISFATTAPNVAPTVSLTAPANNATFTAPASIGFSASASDADGTISGVQFYNGATLIGTDVTAPYSFSWTNVAEGTYTITARATDNSGAVTTSEAISIIVNPAPPNILPKVAITAPLEGSTYTAPVNITITAAASDSDGTVSSVQFFNGTTLLGTDNTAPYSITWSNAVAGNHLITARATDNRGGVTTSTAVSIVVNPAPNQAPTVSITAPANNASFTAPASITVTASATDADGTISSVQFFNGTTLLGSDATSPYSFSWTSVAAGTYSLTAVATDNSGASKTSAAVSITVVAAPVGDIVGPNCGARNTTATFELAPANKTNATSYNWWYTGSSQSVTPQASDRSKVTVVYGANFTAGQLCAGVNYSVAPWYKQYCKAISVCGAKFDPSFTDAEFVEVAQLTIAPNPSSESFTITMPNAVESFEVYNNLGAVIFKGGNIASGESVILGDQFAAGLYTLSVRYADQSTETKRIQKLK